MTRRVFIHTHGFWRTFMCASAFVTGVISYMTFWDVTASTALLKVVLPVFVFALVVTIGIAGHFQHREYPDGLILSTLVLTVIGMGGCASVLYHTVTDTNPAHVVPMVFMGLSATLIALFIKNMAAVFLFSRKD